MQMSLTELWASMGWFARGIAILLIVMSVISLSVAAAKLFRFRKMTTATRAFAPQFSAALEQNNITEALALTEQYDKSHVARVLGESLREVAPLLNDARVAGAAITSAERSVEREQILLANDLKSGLGLLATIGATSPFVGLFGTVWGIMNSFVGISKAQTTNLAVVAPGIAEALLATAIGLFAAIPAVVAYNRYSHVIDRLSIRFESFIEEFLNILQRQATADAPASRARVA